MSDRSYSIPLTGSGASSAPVPPAISVSVTPATSSLQAGASQQFTSSVSGSTNTAVTWSVNGITGGNATVGTISSTGLYQAPSVTSVATETITATSTADTTKSAKATATVSPVATVTSVSVSPTAASVQVGKAQQFSDSVSGNSNTSVVWLVNNIQGGNSTVGTVNASGLYAAPSAVPANANVTVTVQSAADATKVANAVVTVTAAPVPVSVSVTPASATLQTGVTQQFSATVSGTTNTAVTWSVNGVTGGNATVGTISSSGLYTAPSVTSSATETISATSAADTTKSASATASVSPAPVSVSVTISPTSSSLQAGKTQQFTATVSGTTSTGVNWLVNNVQGGNSSVGTISSTGLYTAPTGLSSSTTMSVTAQSAYYSSSSASANVLIASSTSSGGVPPAANCTKYVATTGSDSTGNGSSSSPWQTIQHAADNASAGDVVCVADGTYSSCSTGSSIAYVSHSGSSGNPITFESQNKWGAKLTGTGSCQYGFQLYGSYINVKDFDISGFAVDAGGQGIILAGGSNHTITGNNIHNIANYNSTSGYGMNGIYVYQNSSYDTVDGNVFHDIGRTGSFTYWADHGIYSDGASNQTYENNVFYNITHGWGVQIGSHAQSNMLVINNTFDIANPNATGDIVMESVCTNCRIANNIFYNPSTACISNYSSLSGGSYTIDDNDCTLGTLVSPSGTFYTTSNNHLSLSTSGLMLSPSSHDYHLVGGSPAIDVGSSTNAPNHDYDGVARPQGGGYDIGAYEY